MQQQSRRVPAQQIKNTEDNMFNEEEYNDIWPTRMPTSSRRYQRIPDVRTEIGRRQGDAQLNTNQRYYASDNTRANRAVIPARRTATQTGLPAVQGSRQRNVYTDDIHPLSQNRRVSSMQGFNHKKKILLAQTCESRYGLHCARL